MSLTIKDIAARADVSSATVSRVINNSGSVSEETREKVLNVIEESNYIPNAVARSLSKNDTNTIGVVIPDLTNPFFGEVINGITKEAEKHDINIILCNTNEDVESEKKYLQMLKEQRIKGIIITPTSDRNEFNSEYLSLLENIGTPIVLVDRDVKYSNFDGVFLDNVRGAFDSVQALIDQGHEDIAIIAGPKTSKPGRDRFRGYKKAMVLNSKRIKDEYIFFGDFKLGSGYEITKEILSMENPPTAIFSCNNMMTMGAIKALIENDMTIPDDIAMVGFDEIEAFNVLGIPLSVVSRPTCEMGSIAMNMLLNKLEEEDVLGRTNRVTLTPKLTLKGSEKRKK